LVLEVAPSEVDFGVVALGQFAEESLTLRNEERAMCSSPSSAHRRHDLTLIEWRSPVPGGGEEELTIQWTPSSGQVLDGSLDWGGNGGIAQRGSPT
jgi:hypothetical protein